MKANKTEKENFNDIDFASTIYNIRMERKLTQKQIAEIIGVSDRTISKWEQGDTVPDLYSIRNICNELDVSPSSIVKSKKTLRDRFNNLKRSAFKVFNYVLKNIFIICFAVIFFFLLAYFINNYNMVKIYNIKYESDNITIAHSYFIKTKSTCFLNINKITLDKIKYTPKNIRLELYTYYLGDKFILHEATSLEDIYIEESKNSTDLLNADVITSMKNNLYLDIYATDENDEETKYTSILSLQNEFSSNKLSYNKATLSDKYDNKYLSFLNVKTNSFDNFNLGDSFEITEKVKSDSNNKLSKLGYEYESKNNLYYKEVDEWKISYMPTTKILKYVKEDKNNRVEIVYNDGCKKMAVKILEKETNKYVTFKVSKTDTELNKKYYKYKKEIDVIIKEYMEINSILK